MQKRDKFCYSYEDCEREIKGKKVKGNKGKRGGRGCIPPPSITIFFIGLKSSTILQSVADAAIWTSNDGSSNN
jgi:hypothetical protein